MTHIKKMVMQGFKSFARKTEVEFDKGINIFVGPNGSGKSNVSDALCFVLGRLSIKSMRAARAKNLLFMGSPIIKPAREAFVELIFDNMQRDFGIEKNEISIKRVVRHNGQSVYKINEEVKTRGEVIEMLAQAGIDPYGFNLILQGQINSIVKMHPEDRRKILEEVAGISIYESRKERSLKELEKTEERIKEIMAILRERNAYLRNLEMERSQALKFKELETTVKRCKASILSKKINFKARELESVRKSIDDKSKQKEKVRLKSEELRAFIENLNEKITQINRHIQKSTGIEQESLHEAISNLRAELEGLRIRKENYEHRKSEIEKRIEEIKSSIPEYEREINDLRKKSPLMARKQQELQKKKEELAVMEEEKKQSYVLKNNLNAAKEKIKEKNSQLHKTRVESDSLIKQIEEYTVNFKHRDYSLCEKSLYSLKEKISFTKALLEKIGKSEIEQTKKISSAEESIRHVEGIKEKIKQIDICPLCQNKMTSEHVKHINSDCKKQIDKAFEIVNKASEELKKIQNKRNEAINEIENLDKLSFETERELFSHNLISEKQEYVKKLVEQENHLREEVLELESKRDGLERKSLDSSRIEEAYSSKIREIEEISSRTEEDLDTTLLYKERDLEKMKEVIRLSKKDLREIVEEINELAESLRDKTKSLEKKEHDEEELNEKFKKMFNERDSIQKNIQDKNYELSTTQSELRQIEEQVNFLKIGNARLDAEKEALEMEGGEFPGVEIINGTVEVLQEKLQKAQLSLSTIGSINMRALEVYDEVKKEYERVKDKVDILEKEKNEIFRIIDEIDAKKKRTFMKTFKGVNELFSENFSKLYSKGSAFLEIENKEDIFSGGINIAIKLAKGKYFDVTSLSGGEQTLIALSLLFAIQEYKPYHFYIFDEIDAALDKRNSERLSALLKKYIKSGQYIIITHNDALIFESNILYGVSMHEGVSKIFSLKVD